MSIQGESPSSHPHVGDSQGSDTSNFPYYQMQTHPISNAPSYYFNNIDDHRFSLTPTMSHFPESQFLHSTSSPQYSALPIHPIHPIYESPSFYPYLLCPDSPPQQYPPSDHDNYEYDQEREHTNVLYTDPDPLILEPMHPLPHQPYDTLPHYLSKQTPSNNSSYSYDVVNPSVIPSASVTLSPTLPTANASSRTPPPNTIYNIVDYDINNRNNNNDSNTNMSIPPMIPILSPSFFVNNQNNNSGIAMLPLPPMAVPPAPPPPPSAPVLVPLVPKIPPNGFQLYPPLIPLDNNSNKMDTTPNNATILSIYNIERVTTNTTDKNEPNEAHSFDSNILKSSDCNTNFNVIIPRIEAMDVDVVEGRKKEIKMESKKTKRVRQKKERKESVETENKTTKTSKRTRKRRVNKKKEITKKITEDAVADQERRKIKNPKTRRKHTAIACIRCWKAKTRCSVKRPCDRCIRLAYDDCVDRPSSSRRRQNVSRKKSTKSKSKKVQTQKHRDHDCKGKHAHECKHAPPRDSRESAPSPSLSKLPQLKPENLWSVRTSSLSEIMSSFNKEKEMANETITKKELLSSKSLPINYQYTHIFPPNMVKLFERPLLQDLGPDTSFTYFPIISRYQISTKPYCESCYGLLLNQEKNMMHLQTPHNYPCPNRECHREFVQESHLAIHLKICSESLKLTQDVKGTKQKRFDEIINFVIKSPISNYVEMVNDVYPSKQWVEQQMEWKQKQRRKKGKKIKNETQNSMENRSPKRKLPDLMRCDSLNQTNNKGSEKEEEVYTPSVKRRKISKSIVD